MKKIVYKVEQLPSSIEENCVEWSLTDSECNVRITRLPSGKTKLSGEWLIWNEDKQDWEGQQMTRNEVVEIIHRVDLVLPTSKGDIHLKEKFQIKSPA